MSVSDEIRKLAELKDDGHLTSNEFEFAKRELLGIHEDGTEVLKKVEFYGASVTAWLNYGLELNKQILLFSSGGLALLLGIVTSDKFSSEAFILYFVYVCSISYLICLGSVLGEFKMSRVYIQKMLVGQQESDKSAWLTWLGRLSVASFVVGTISLTGLVVFKMN